MEKRQRGEEVEGYSRGRKVKETSKERKREY